jgi:uncharacterized protein
MFNPIDRWIAPDWQVADIRDVSAALLRLRGRRGLLLDLDGTLKGHYATEFAADIRDWVDGLRSEGIQLAIVSNGTPEHVVPLARRLDIPCFPRARKPLPLICRRALKALGVDAEQGAILGDQLFTDVLAGRWAKLFTIFVPPASPAEPWHIRLRRPLERRLLRSSRCAAPDYPAGQFPDSSDQTDSLSKTR